MRGHGDGSSGCSSSPLGRQSEAVTGTVLLAGPPFPPPWRSEAKQLPARGHRPTFASAPRSSLKRFFCRSGADIHGLWKMAKNSTAQNSHQVSSIRGSQFSYASLRWQMRFFDVSTAVFHAHAERCLKQDGALPILKKMPYGAQHQLKKSESTSSSKLGRLISTFYLRPHSGLWHFLL